MVVGGQERVTTEWGANTATGLKRDKVVKIARLSGCKKFVGKTEKFILDAFVDFQLMEIFEKLLIVEVLVLKITISNIVSDKQKHDDPVISVIFSCDFTHWSTDFSWLRTSVNWINVFSCAHCTHCSAVLLLSTEPATKLQQICPPLLAAVLTLPCETKHKSICSFHNSNNEHLYSPDNW